MRIQVLPQEVAEKIAAGEVVERPASVIKELMENSLDAEATRVEVRTGPDMTDRLEVLDDGTGMSPQEVCVALRRHATSKIVSVQDLEGIATLGFRGEALASLAAVADLQIDSRTEGAPVGVRVRMLGGAQLETREVAMNRGTRIVVRSLFQTTPARLKFLRSRQTETGHVLDTFVRLALSRKDVSFLLTKNDRPWLEAPAAGLLEHRAAHLFGWELAERLLPLSAAPGDLRLEGLVGPADLHRGSARGLFLFVNRRPVRDVMLLRAVHEAYRGRVPMGRTPVAILFLELPYSQVDVNVHPGKMEVHFARPDVVRALFVGQIARILDRVVWSPGRGGGRQANEPVAPRHEPVAMTGTAPAARGVSGSRGHDPAPSWKADSACAREAVGEEPLESGIPGLVFTRFHVLGQFLETYLVCEYRDQLLLVDQHAAHERIAYERLEEAYAGRQMLKQTLLTPPVVDLPPREAECVRHRRDLLFSFGLEVEPYGGMSFAVKAVPAILADADPERLLRDVAEELAVEERTQHMDRLRSQVFARMACHAVVRAGRSLEDREMRALLRDLDERPGRVTCPHGRPVVIAWSEQEIRKRFQRGS